MLMSRRFSWRSFFGSRLFFVGGVAVLLLLSVSLTRAQLKDRAIRQEIAKLEQEVAALEDQRNAFQELIALIDNPEFLEKTARKSLGYALPGEEVVVIGKREQQEQREQREQKKWANPRKWWVYFFGGS